MKPEAIVRKYSIRDSYQGDLIEKIVDNSFQIDLPYISKNGKKLGSFNRFMSVIEVNDDQNPLAEFMDKYTPPSARDSSPAQDEQPAGSPSTQ